MLKGRFASTPLRDEDINTRYPVSLQAILKDVRSAYNKAVALNADSALSTSLSTGSLATPTPPPAPLRGGSRQPIRPPARRKGGELASNSMSRPSSQPRQRTSGRRSLHHLESAPLLGQVGKAKPGQTRRRGQGGRGLRDARQSHNRLSQSLPLAKGRTMANGRTPATRKTSGEASSLPKQSDKQNTDTGSKGRRFSRIRSATALRSGNRTGSDHRRSAPREPASGSIESVPGRGTSATSRLSAPRKSAQPRRPKSAANVPNTSGRGKQSGNNNISFSTAASVARLATKQSTRQAPQGGNARLFRNFHNLTPETRIMTATARSQSREVWRSLEKRGWFLNDTSNREVYDLLWTQGSSSVPWNSLEPHQKVNHFRGNGALTTKAGLSSSLHNLKWKCDTDIDEFFPECFDLSIPEERSDFIEKFQLRAAEAVLKAYLNPRPIPDIIDEESEEEEEEEEEESYDSTDDDTGEDSYSETTSGDEDGDDSDGADTMSLHSQQNGSGTPVVSSEEEGEEEERSGSGQSTGSDDDEASMGTEAGRPDVATVRAALKIIGGIISLHEHLADTVVEDAFSSKHYKASEPVTELLLADPLYYRLDDVTDEEWYAVLNSPIFPVRRHQSSRISRVMAQAAQGSGGATTHHLPKHGGALPDDEDRDSRSKSGAGSHSLGRYGKFTSGNGASGSRLAVWNVDNVSHDSLGSLIDVALERVKAHIGVQYDLNVSYNMWIVKPAGKSRGKGIDSFCNIRDILTYVSAREEHWVAQKYIENALVVKERKFDIRQWVLVTSYHPLRVYFYDRSYLRFCTKGFSLDNMADKFLHLANHAVQEHGDDFGTDPEFPGNMWSSEEMRSYLIETYGDDSKWRNHLAPSMERLIVQSLLSAQDKISTSKNSFELFGYDFMVDDQWRVYLIEINENPSLEQATPITKELVPLAIEDMVKLVVDDNARASVTQAGHWRQIYNEKKVSLQTMAGVNLSLQGQKVVRK